MIFSNPVILQRRKYALEGHIKQSTQSSFAIMTLTVWQREAENGVRAGQLWQHGPRRLWGWRRGGLTLTGIRNHFLLEGNSELRLDRRTGVICLEQWCWKRGQLQQRSKGMYGWRTARGCKTEPRYGIRKVTAWTSNWEIWYGWDSSPCIFTVVQVKDEWSVWESESET